MVTEFQRGLSEIRPLDKLRSLVDESEVEIERELAKPVGNLWLACFNTRLLVVEMYLTRFERDGSVSADKIQSVREKLSALTSRSRKLGQDFGFDPSQDIKSSLLEDLKKILD